MMATETGREFAQIVVESNDDEIAMMDSISSNRRHSCFCIPCFNSSRSSTTTGSNWWRRIREAEHNDDRWWSRGITALRKVREWSEIVAGPRWKTFIRRFNRSKSGGGGGGGGRHGRFNYDPLSYSLNFDEGAAKHGDSDEEYGFRNFSSRYASIPITAKSSTDLGKDPPTFT